MFCRVLFVLILALSLVQSAYAEVPRATCDELLAGYNALSPFRRDDLERIVGVLIDSHLFVKDESRNEYATREQLIAEVWLRRNGPELWVNDYNTFLEQRLKSLGCVFESRRLVLMTPPPVTPTCKGPLPSLTRPLTR